jgi:hypothetical protein
MSASEFIVLLLKKIHGSNIMGDGNLRSYGSANLIRSLQYLYTLYTLKVNCGLNGETGV